MNELCHYVALCMPAANCEDGAGCVVLGYNVRDLIIVVERDFRETAHILCTKIRN